MPRKRIYLFNEGDVYGRLTVIKELPLVREKGRPSCRYILCRCSCGKETTVLALGLVSRNTASCGCLKKENRKCFNLKHGMCNTKQYKMWQTFKCRHGDEIDSRRENFSLFWDDMKNSYSDDVMLCRIDRHKDYCKENCFWKKPHRRPKILYSI